MEGYQRMAHAGREEPRASSGATSSVPRSTRVPAPSLPFPPSRALPVPRRTLKAGELAQAMGEWLASAGIEPGARIGDRSSLAAQWGVSESTMRESVRLLEAAGVVEQRVGVGGGVFYNPHEAGIVAQVLAWSARLGRADYAESLEALADVEALIAARAARAASPDQIRRCEEAARSTADLSSAGPRDSRFHEVLAECAGNRVLALLRRALAETVAAQAERLQSRGGAGARDPDHVTYSHAHIVGAVRDRDAAEAARRARKHIRVALES